MGKRREKGSGTLRKVSREINGKRYEHWEGQITVGTDPGTGKQKRKTFTGKTQKEVREKMQAAAVSVNEGQFFEPSKLTVKEWFETWLSEYMAAVKPLTVRQYRSMSETHIYPAIGAIKLSKLTAPQLQKFYNQLAVDGKTVKRKNEETGKTEVFKEPLSAKTIRNIHDIINKALNTAISQGMIKDNVSQRTTIPKVIQKEVQPLTEDQQKDFIAAVQNHKYRNLFILMLFTGLREGETIGLTWDCVDWKTSTLKVYQQLQRVPGNWSEFRFVPLKNSKARYIRLSPYIMKLLEDRHKQQAAEKLKAGDMWQGFKSVEAWNTALIFTDEIGRNINPAPLYENFKKIAAQIGVPDARLHDLRHTFACISLQNGDDVKTVQSNLGHATAAFTIDRYCHLTERMREESARRQQEYIKALGL